MRHPDPTLLADIVSPKVLRALELASQALTAARVRHVVVGGIAVGANGYPRNTTDVELLVGDEAFERDANGLVTLRAGVPFQVDGVAVDFLSPEPGESFLEDALSAPPGSIIEAGPLVYMKLKAARRKDQVDVIELVRASLDIDGCRAFLTEHAAGFVPLFDQLVERASRE